MSTDPKPLSISRFRVLNRGQLEKLCVALAGELLIEVWYTPEEGNSTDPGFALPDRHPETAEEASSMGYQALATAMDPTYDYTEELG